MMALSRKTNRVLFRFGLRLLILTSFAAMASLDFARSLAALLWMAIILCAVVAAIRREPPWSNALNHWDEAAAFAALFCLASTLKEVTPI